MRLRIHVLLLVAGFCLAASAALAQTPIFTTPGGTVDEPGGPVDPADDPLKRENHYKCYEILEHSEVREILVTTRDQFGFNYTHVYKPRYLCNPVYKNDEYVPEWEVHQVCYEIRDERETNLPPTLLIRNQFGETKITKLAQPSLLCVPSYKFHI